MFARSTSVQANVSSIDAGITHVNEEVLPALMHIDGCVGLSMVVDRDSGLCIVTSSWQSADAMHASADRIAPLRDGALQILGGTAEIREWEIAVMHREHSTHDGACVRVTWLQTDAGNVDDLVDTFRMSSLPQIEDLDGFCSTSFLISRGSGAAVSSSCFEDRAALDASREEANRIRTAGTRQAAAAVLEVREFDLAVAHLRVPEMA